MTISRIYQPIPLAENKIIQLNDQAMHHVARVLRASVGDELIIFNGEGGEYLAVITEITKKNVTVTLKHWIDSEVESPLELCLAQGISRGEKMDFTIQKAVELGVKKIIPLFTERCNVKLDDERKEKRKQHWHSIIIGACEQSGRNQIPEIVMPDHLTAFLQNHSAEIKFVLSPQATHTLSKTSLPPSARVTLLIGPEGGLSENEIQLANQHGFLSLNLGPRILRTETAAIAALTALQCYAGDLA